MSMFMYVCVFMFTKKCGGAVLHWKFCRYNEYGIINTSSTCEVTLKKCIPEPWQLDAC